jgi:type I restriction enzyme, S subunit
MSNQYKPYPKYKDSGVEWIGEVPDDWEVKPIKILASCNDDSLTESVSPDVRIRYVDISSVSHDNGITNAELMLFESAPSRARRKAKVGDVVVSTVRTYLKAVASVDESHADCIFSTGFAVLRSRDRQLKPEFLKWLALNELLIQAVESHSEGLSYPAINASELVNLKTVAPNLNEQTLISSTLNHQTTHIDTLIQKKTRFIELLKEKRQALITAAVTGKIDVTTGKPYPKYKDSGVEWIGEVPEGWDVRRMATIFREAIREGRQDLPILSISIHHGITDEELTPGQRERQTYQIEDRTKYKRVKPNDLAYNMMRAWQGGFGAVKVEGLVSPAYVVAKPTACFHTSYIELLLRTSMAIEEMRRYSRGIADFRMRLYWDYFRDLKVCLPSETEQEQILNYISSESKRVDLLISKTGKSIDLLKERRSALITAAVTGKIDLRDSQ